MKDLSCPALFLTLLLLSVAGVGAKEDSAPEAPVTEALAEPLEPIRVSADGKRFVRGASGESFIVWGVNYDHDGAGRLLDEYWEDEWETVVADFREMRELGANCVRVHLQFGKFMEAPGRANARALARLAKLVELAEETRLYLDVTGLACYHKQNIPEWYDGLSEQDRWAAQAVFWDAVAGVCAGSPALFCYDLMNEPILPGKEAADEWLTGELGGKFFVQRISLDLQERSREEVAQAWVERMVTAIRKRDPHHLITVGVIPWVFTFGGGKPLFHGAQVGRQLDFVAVHFYPEKQEIEKALQALKAYEMGKPLVIEEMFPLKCSQEELIEFVNRSAEHVDGWISFYWGQTARELREKDSPTIGEAITASWLETFQTQSKVGKPPKNPQRETREAGDSRPPGGDGSLFYRVFVSRNDKNADGVIERGEFRGGDERFAQLDLNANGKLDRTEIDALHRSRVADPLSMRERIARGETRRPPVDLPPNPSAPADADEGASRPENGEPFAVTPLGTRITAQEAFARLDGNTDGKVSATEFQRSPGMAEAEKARAVVAKVDRDGDGSLSFTEFNQVFAQRHGGGTPADKAVAASSPGEAETFKVIGYQPSWAGDVEAIPYDKLTHINYSFILPKADGTFEDMPHPARLRKLVKLAHANAVKVGIAIGGWNGGDDSAFETLAASPESRTRFVEETLNMVRTYGLDGVDMDWEYPDAGDSSAHFLTLMRSLSTALRREDKYLSAAVVSQGSTGEGISREVFPLVDMLNIMAYDGRNHGLYSQAEAAIQYWSERGCPRNKRILGLPFYGRSPYRAYRDLVQDDPTTPRKDVLGEIRYNGTATIQKKTRLGLEKCGGVMIWELSQDIDGEDSLLRAVTEVIAAHPLRPSP